MWDQLKIFFVHIYLVTYNTLMHITLMYNTLINIRKDIYLNSKTYTSNQHQESDLGNY